MSVSAETSWRVTVISISFETPPIVAVIITFWEYVKPSPPLRPVTTPLWSTVAIEESAEDHTKSPWYAPAGLTLAIES